MDVSRIPRNTRQTAAKRRRERNAELARRDILAAAAEAFVEHGYRAATIQDIAARAGFNPASLYVYFRGKEEIFNALIDSVVDDFEAVLSEPVDARLAFERRLGNMVRASLHAAERHRHALVYFVRLQEHGGSRPSATKRSGDTLVELEGWFRRHTAPSDIGGFTTSEAAALFWSVFGGIVRLWAINESDIPLAEHSGRLTRFILHGFRGSSPAAG